jgi:hypothetical protein
MTTIGSRQASIFWESNRYGNSALASDFLLTSDRKPIADIAAGWKAERALFSSRHPDRTTCHCVCRPQLRTLSDTSPIRRRRWYGYAGVSIDFSMSLASDHSTRAAALDPLATALKCPNCNSTDLKKLSLIHAAGVYESRGSLRGLFLGNSDGLLFGRFRGTSQSRLSKMTGPPKKMPYAVPTVLWLLGFFILMAFDGRGKLSWVMGMLSVVYVFLLPAWLLASLSYNFFICPRKYRNWERKFMCQRCGIVVV